MNKALYLIITSYLYTVTFFSQHIPIFAYTLTPSQSVSDGQTFVSQGGKFELGFFSPSTSSRNRYLGIWYKTIPIQTVVWVANRASPLLDTSGVLKIDGTGNIVIVNGTESIIWSSNSSNAVESPIVEFLESGNLVLRDATNKDMNSSLWQSFDYPGNTMLPGMKIGWNLKTGLNRYLSSWRSSDDPSPGNFTYGIELAGNPELAMRKGPRRYIRLGIWNGNAVGTTLFKYETVINEDENFFRYRIDNEPVILYIALMQTGTEGRFGPFLWNDTKSSWDPLPGIPGDICDEYALCGIYSICETNPVTPPCNCLKGFRPKSQKEWNLSKTSEGCQREVPLNCKTDGFQRLVGIKLPETANSYYNMNMTLQECRVMCLRNCSCLAYSNVLLTGGGTGCNLWFTDLIDIKQLISFGQDLYIRMPASESDPEANDSSKRGKLKTAVSVTAIVGLILFGLASWCVWKKSCSRDDSGNDDLELSSYSLATMIVATNNFSAENKLGEGGFGPVYKGKLEDGKEIAVKKRSKNSTQGMDEFKNEVLLIAKLQHRNLVKLLGCCIEKKEKMLVYEYMPNNSLDSYIFDETKRRLLDWEKRFKIIQGIAGGLHYLHHFSRLMIIHRDLKASNVLLDSEMAPKISDFGMARIFRGDQVEEKTKKVVGTYGYMSPEYVMGGHFSEKSDVFSFGVLVLEIISGKKNWGFHHPEHGLNLLGHAWKLWSEDRSLEFVDKFMSISSFHQDILRCIHIGLLCVQNETKERPSMSAAVIMLGSETAVLSNPQKPGFYMETSPRTLNPPHRDEDIYNSNKRSITVVEAR